MFRTSTWVSCQHVLSGPSNSIQHQTRYCSRMDLQTLISQHLGIDKSFANSVIISGNGVLFKVPERRLIANCLLCKDLVIDEKQPKHIERCLRLGSITIKHRINLLQEMGIKNVHMAQIFRLSKILQNAVLDVKTAYGISVDEDIIQNIINSISDDLPNDFYDQHAADAPLIVADHCKRIILKYKQWKLQTTNPRLNLYQTPIFQSLRMVKAALELLTRELGFDTSFILKFPYLTSVCAENARSIVNGLEDEKIGGRPFTEIVKKWPYLLHCDVNNVKQMLQHLKEYNVTDSAVLNSLEIFKLDSSVFVKRMKECKNSPDLSTWVDHPRILYMIRNKGLVDKRLHQLRSTNYVKRVNTHTISSVNPFFKRILQDETHCLAHWKFLKYIMQKELGMMDEDAVYRLSLHPYWRNITFREIETTVRYLKLYFSPKDIYANIHVVLYARSRVEKALMETGEAYSPEKGYDFTPSQKLAIALYTLERRNYFSGDGVWLREGDPEADKELYQVSDFNMNKFSEGYEEDDGEDKCQPSMDEESFEHLGDDRINVHKISQILDT